MIFYIADAFTEELFGGNPAGVVILQDGEDFPSNEIMRKTAAELRYSETAFIKQLSPKEFNIKYFTPADEVELCGHATIGSFMCLLDAGLIKSGCEYINKTLAGDLRINADKDFIMMEMAPPQYIDTISNEPDLKELYAIMGLEYKPVRVQTSQGNHLELLPMMISTGLPDIMMPVTSEEKLTAISPDFEKLTELSRKYDVVGAHAFALDEGVSGITAHCRNFAPLYDIDEEAATGTSNGALTYYLYRHGLLSDESESTFIQGEAMDRPSRILSRIQAGTHYDQIPDDSKAMDKVSIQVGGSAVILAKGDIRL